MKWHHMLATPRLRRQWVLDTTPQEFVAQLPRWNALLRGLNPVNHGFYDGFVWVDRYHDPGNSNSWDISLLSPAPKDKIPLLERAWQSAQISAENPRLNDARAMRRIGLTIAGAVNLVHAFRNGSGRLGRYWGYVLDQGDNGTPKSADRIQRAALNTAERGQVQWHTDLWPYDGRLSSMVAREAVPEPVEPTITPIRITSNPDSKASRGYWRPLDFPDCGLTDVERLELVCALNNFQIGFAALYQTLNDRDLLQDSMVISGRQTGGSGYIGASLKTGDAIVALDICGLRDFIRRHQQLQVRVVDIFSEEMAYPRREFSHTRVEYGDGTWIELSPTLPDVYERHLAERSALCISVSHNAPPRSGATQAATVDQQPHRQEGPGRVVAAAKRVWNCNRRSGGGRASAK